MGTGSSGERRYRAWNRTGQSSICYRFFFNCLLALCAIFPAQIGATDAANGTPKLPPPSTDWVGTPWIGRTIMGKMQNLEGLHYADLQLMGSFYQIPDGWLDNGKKIVCVDVAGTITTLSVPDFCVLKRMNAGHSVRSINQTRTGIVVSSGSGGVSYLETGSNLNEKIVPFVKGAEEYQGHFPLSSVFQDHVFFYNGGGFDEFEPKNGKFIRTLPFIIPDILRPDDIKKKNPALTKIRIHPASMVMKTPLSFNGSMCKVAFADKGKCILMSTVWGPILKIDIAGAHADLIEVGPPVGVGGAEGLSISDDGQYFSIRALNTESLVDHPDIGHDSVYIYRVLDLQKPVSFIVKPANLNIGFDSVKHQYYAASEHKFEVWNAKGELVKSWQWEIPDFGNGTSRILVHPDGGSALICTGKRIIWVTIP